MEPPGPTAPQWDASGKPAGVYRYRVRSCLTLCGNPSAIVTETVTGGGTGAPAIPTLNEPDPNPSTGHFVLRWSSSPTAQHYRMYESRNGGQSWSTLQDNIHATEIPVDRGEGSYRYRVQACIQTFQTVCSSYSNIVIATVQGSGIPPIPTGLDSTLDGCSEDRTDVAFTISWNTSPGAHHYILTETHGTTGAITEYSTTATFQGFVYSTTPSDGGSVTYSYTVKACNSANQCSLDTAPVTACIGIAQTINGPDSTPIATAYDAFGKVRNGDYSDRPGGKLNLLPDTVRGFTNHQHVDDVRLIHMNGRVYDYQLGRFLSVDPIIGNPRSTQSINPYSYIGNNPLSGVDPTGYVACSDVSVDQTNASGTCDIAGADGKTVSVGYSFNGNGDVGLSTSGNTGAASAAVSVGIMANNGADATSPKGPASSSIAGVASAIGAMADSMGQQTQSMATGVARSLVPETAALHDQGGGHGPLNVNDAQGAVVGAYNTGARAVNEAISLAAFLFNNIHNKDFVDYEAFDAFPLFVTPPELQRGRAIGEWIALGASIFAAPERLATNKSLVPYYPPNSGFAQAPGRYSLLTGTVVDRYGSLGGSFLSPQGTPSWARALPYGAETRQLRAFEVMKPFEVDAGYAAPWFGQRGGGVQYDLGRRSVSDLIDGGYLRELK